MCIDLKWITPRYSLSIIFISLFLSACGGEAIDLENIGDSTNGGDTLDNGGDTPDNGDDTPDNGGNTPDSIALFESGAEIYESDCASCHGPLKDSLKRYRTLDALTTAIDTLPQMQNIQRSNEELEAVIYALNNDDPNASQECVSNVATQSPIRRITENEYDNVIQELLNVSMHDTTNLSDDSLSGPFATNRGTPTSAADVLSYLDSAELIANIALNGSDSRDNWTLNSSDNSFELNNAIDGDPSTRWATGRVQTPGQWLTIDLGSTRRINQIVLDSQESPNDSIINYEVTVSDDGVSWGSPIASGNGASPNVEIDFDTVSTRHIRLEQLGSSNDFWWSIHELNVFGDDAESSLLACDSLACAEDFVDSFVRLAYRGSETEEELNSLKSLLNDGDPLDGVQLVIEIVLQSPKFLYQVERSVSGSGSETMERLTGLSIAEKLASFLWNSVPDDELLAAAQNGDLDSDAGVQEQAERMISDPKASSSFADFVEQWFETDSVLSTQKDRDTYPEFDGLRAGMRAETKAFVKWMIETDNFNYQELLTSSKAFPGEVLAEFYNVSSQAEGAPIDLDGRVGILSHPSVTASHARLTDTSVVSRGDFMLDALLCIDLPEPPANVEALFAGIDPTLPTRERLAKHTEDPDCAGCHSFIDPLGFALESYDAIGAYRDTDNLGFAVETYGTLDGTDNNGSFDDITGLMDRVLSSNTGKSCAVEQWMRFAQRRVLNANDDCSVNDITEAFEDSNYDFNALVRAVVTSDTFLYRDATGANR